MDRVQMRDEYDFSNGVRGRFYQPNEPKRYVITLDHRPKVGRFEVDTDEHGAFRYSVKAETGTILVSNGPYHSRRDALEALKELRETVIGAETVEAE